MSTVFTAVDIGSVDGNSNMTCPAVADAEHCFQVQRAVANVLNKQSATGNRKFFWLFQGITPFHCKEDWKMCTL
jgi:hypothetical protein